jgi:hypothetical protein
MTITLRTQSATGASTKGSTLTHVELDNNFIDILQNKIQAVDVRGDTGTQLVGQSLGNEVLNVVGGTGISTAVTSDSAGQARITITNSQTAFVPASPGEIGASTPDVGNFTDLKVKSASSTVKELQLYDQDNTNYVGFKSPTTVSTNKIYVLPATDGSPTHVLQTDGSGNLSWVASSSFAPASPGEIGASTPADASFLNLNVKSASSTVKELRLHDQDNSNYVGFKSPTSVTTNKVYVLPATDGTATHFLQTDGSGNLSWAAGSTFAPASPGEIGATTPDTGNFTDLKVKSASSTVKELQLHDQDNTNYVGFKAPVTVSSNRVWTLPSADGTANQVLSTNGSGTLSFATASVAISTGVTGLGSNVATFLATPSSANLISAITDETGTGALVFATSPTLVTPALGTPASGNLTNTTVDGTNKVGYRVLPAVGTKSGSYTLAVGDVGEYVQVASGGSITIPNSTFAEGDVIVIVNNHTAAITITCTITDAYIAGTDTDKATVSLATRGVCNILFLSGTRCIITGNVS